MNFWDNNIELEIHFFHNCQHILITFSVCMALRLAQFVRCLGNITHIIEQYLFTKSYIGISSSYSELYEINDFCTKTLFRLSFLLICMSRNKSP